MKGKSDEFPLRNEYPKHCAPGPIKNKKFFMDMIPVS
jgi:hypothetical protein